MSGFFTVLAAAMPLAPVEELSDDAAPTEPREKVDVPPQGATALKLKAKEESDEKLPKAMTKNPKGKAKSTPKAKGKAKSKQVSKKPAAAPATVLREDDIGPSEPSKSEKQVKMKKPAAVAADPDGDDDPPEPESRETSSAPKRKAYKCFYARNGSYGIKCDNRQVMSVPRFEIHC